MKLRNCPFCGSEPEVSMYGPLIEGEPRIVIWCVNSECPMDDVGGNNFDTEDAAIKAWNTRADVWISVEDRLPGDKQYVLVDPPFISGAFKDEPRHVLFWNKRLGRFQYYLGDSVHNAYDIRHWRTLPNYAYSTMEEYESIVGFKVNDAFKMGWDMARTTNEMLGIINTREEKNETL